MVGWLGGLVAWRLGGLAAGQMCSLVAVLIRLGDIFFNVGGVLNCVIRLISH